MKYEWDEETSELLSDIVAAAHVDLPENIVIVGIAVENTDTAEAALLPMVEVGTSILDSDVWQDVLGDAQRIYNATCKRGGRDMTQEYKTLRELDVQPGDVVRNKYETEVTISRLDARAAVDTDDGFPWQLHNPIWRIVSRASDTPKPYTPGERQAVAERPRASVSPDHSWEPASETPKLWRDMTPEEKGALLLAHHEGKAIDAGYVGGGWYLCDPKWFDEFAYRVRPKPKRETVTLVGGFHAVKTYWHFGDNKAEFGDTHCITFDLIDGKPDCDSIKMEELPL
jgi:hypothetical protein